MTISHADVPRYYLEDENGDTFPTSNLTEWIQDRLAGDNVVGHELLPESPDQDERLRVSTVFTGVNQDISRHPALLYETAVFRGTSVLELIHSETREAALQTHNALVDSYTSLQ